MIETKRTMTPTITILEQVHKCRKLSLSLDLQHYILDKIFDHYRYFNSKKIAKDYLGDTNIIDMQYNHQLNDEDRKILMRYTFRISRFLGILKLLGFIERYNSTQFRKTELMTYPN